MASDLVEVRIIGTPNEAETVAVQIKSLFEGMVARDRTYPSRKADGKVLRYLSIKPK